MWDNHQTLRLLANTMFVFLLVLIMYIVGPWAINLPIFPLKEVSVAGNGGKLEHVTRDQINSVIRSQAGGNFFTVDLEAIRNALIKLPWVRTASVRRHWPKSLEIVLEEHMVLALWGDLALVNTYGEIFEGVTNTRLPKFIGQMENVREMTNQHAIFNKLLQPLGMNIAQIDLSPRRAWRIYTNNGVALELGREQVEDRLVFYISAHNQMIEKFKKQLTYVDLRYSNGFAVRLPEITQ
ncbi:MAG: cell division protein FtsQ/DivIB [Nitrosospira sp.]|nr:FtsQ-type POTRA domain-containing protein [Nitrosospira sp.]MBI0414864.1 cell division protein FtsQ/DivIB [Nitrosospira sp.]MBI0416657.1 cell division protein FtsQ/DivIB [Nitrosospira sp.]MBI0419410.1 cell division protein FtsQ/DivIB [Nitrosospira sp.]